MKLEGTPEGNNRQGGENKNNLENLDPKELVAALVLEKNNLEMMQLEGVEWDREKHFPLLNKVKEDLKNAVKEAGPLTESEREEFEALINREQGELRRNVSEQTRIEDSKQAALLLRSKLN